MIIGTECPHCESVFQVDAELTGKSMRCPNPTCREVFTVSIATNAPTQQHSPTPEQTLEGNVGDYVPVVEAEAVAPSIDNAPVHHAEPVLPPVQKAAELPPIPKATPLPTSPVPRAPQVIDWSAEALPAVKKASAKTNRPTDRQDDDSEVPIRTRSRGGGLSGKVIFGSLMVLVLLAAGGTVAFFFLTKLKGEEQEAVVADTLYQDAKYVEAKRKFESLVTEFPDSSDVPRYRFFTALSQAQADASSVTVKDDPSIARRSFDALIAEHGDSPFAQPNTGFGADVVLVGLKLSAAIGDHALELVTKFQSNRSDLTLLDGAEGVIASGRELLPVLEKFRDKSGLTLADVKDKFNQAEAQVRSERDRLATLAPWQNLADDPTDVQIDQFEKTMKAAGLSRDADVLGLAARAKRVLRERVRYEAGAKAAGDPPIEPGATLTVVPRVCGSPEIKQVLGEKDAVFGIANGVLYALDTRTGEKLWAERVSVEARMNSAPLRVTLAGGTRDWVVVPSLNAGQPALTARESLTGVAKWHLPLSAPVIGHPVRVGDFLFVALSDPFGTLLYVNLIDGTLLGRVELRQPIGGGISGLQGLNSGHGFVVVPADARRVFVFETGKLADDGTRQPPHVVRVFATGHPRNSLRMAPVVLDPGDPNRPSRVILSQTDGPAKMMLRSFQIPPANELVNPLPDGDLLPGEIAEASVSGWAWFPPKSDGERLAVCTDKGVFAAFGLNQPGQADKPLYTLPGDLPDPDPAAINRSQIVWMDEDSFWVILNNQLTRLRVASDARDGQNIVPTTESRYVGEPVATPLVRADQNLAVITTRATDTGTIHLQAFDVSTGEVRWQRQLGTVAVGNPVGTADGGRLLVDECGGVYRISAVDDQLTVLPDCEPLPSCVSPSIHAVSADCSGVWVATHVITEAGNQLVVRVIRDGKLEGDERRISLPANLAGNAVVIGERFYFPLANKFLYRFGLSDTELTQGPAWLASEPKPGTVCHLSTAEDGTLLFNDGGMQLIRQEWGEETTKAKKAGGPWVLTSPMTGPAVTTTIAGKEWLLAPDEGGVAVYDPKKPSTDPVQRWHGSGADELPAGKAEFLIPAQGGVLWSVGKGTIAMGVPGRDKPNWVFPLRADAGEVVTITTRGKNVLVTGTSGIVFELNESGEVVAEASLPPGALRAVAAGVEIADDEVVLPLSDGSVSRLPLRAR